MRRLGAVLLCWMGVLVFARADIVASIRPIHSIASFIAGDKLNVVLLVDGNSAHNVQLRPSMLRTMLQSRAVIYIDEQLETFLARALRTLPSSVSRIRLSDAPLDGITRHHGANLHLWLSLANSIVMAEYITEQLSHLYPNDTAFFKGNLNRFIMRANALDSRIRQQLTPVRDKGFIVYHPAYNYFVRDYGLTQLGAVADHHAAITMSTMRHLSALIDAGEVHCIFREPTTRSNSFNAIAGQVGNTATLEPLGSSLPPGANLYFDLMTKMADTVHSCLSKN
jgi:zinc transport system substrate-binding protein